MQVTTSTSIGQRLARIAGAIAMSMVGLGLIATVVVVAPPDATAEEHRSSTDSLTGQCAWLRARLHKLISIATDTDAAWADRTSASAEIREGVRFWKAYCQQWFGDIVQLSGAAGLSGVPPQHAELQEPGTPEPNVVSDLSHIIIMNGVAQEMAEPDHGIVDMKPTADHVIANEGVPSQKNIVERVSI